MSTDPAPDTTLSAEDVAILARVETENAALTERLRVAEERNLLADRVLALAESPGKEVTSRMYEACRRWIGSGTDFHAVKNYALDALLAYAKETLAPTSDAAPKEAT